MQNVTVTGSGNNSPSTEGRHVYLRGTSEISATGESIYYAWALDSRADMGMIHEDTRAKKKL